MKKIILAAMMVFCVASLTTAQTFSKGTQVASVNLGVGYGTPVTLGYEIGVHDINSDMSIGAGATLGLYSSYFVGGVEGNWHYTAIDNFDLYAGVDILYANTILWGIKAGARYYFNDKIAVNAELGSGLSYLNVGVSFKF